MCFNRDPQHYPDPEVFDPDRFTQEERRNRHKAVYLPFSEGPRSKPHSIDSNKNGFELIFSCVFLSISVYWHQICIGTNKSWPHVNRT